MNINNFTISTLLEKQGITAAITGNIAPENFTPDLLDKKINGQPVINILKGGDIDFTQFKDDLLSAYQMSAKETITNKAENYRAQFLGTNNAVKIASYMRKSAYAKQALNGDEGAIQYLTPEAEARGIGVKELAHAILARTQASDKIDAAINGFEVKAKAAIQNLTSLTSIEATLDDLQTQAETHFNALLKG